MAEDASIGYNLKWKQDETGRKITMANTTVGELIKTLEDYPEDFPVRLVLAQYRGSLSYSVGDLGAYDGTFWIVTGGNDDYAPRAVADGSGLQ